MTRMHRRRLVASLIALLLVGATVLSQQDISLFDTSSMPLTPASQSVLNSLESLEVKGRAAKTGYSRQQFGNGWRMTNGCDTRNIILARDLKNVVTGDDCTVTSGILDDPYTNKTIQFKRGAGTSARVQIDHVVALSDAWQKGAQALSLKQRENLANDPLNLLAVDGPANQQKSDGDAATWLPPYKPFRCQYVQRQISVKAVYHLWVSVAEKDAMKRVIVTCR